MEFKSRNITLSILASVAFTLSAPVMASVITGEMAPDFQAVDSNGVTHNLSDFAGQKVVLEWTNHDCPFVKKHYSTDNMQGTQELANADDTVWLSVISSAPGNQGYVTGDQANELTASRDAQPDAVILDPSGAVGKLYGAKTTPHMYIINETGTLVYQGAIDDNRSASPATVATATNYVKTAMNELRAGSELSTPESQPYGCSVKY